MPVFEHALANAQPQNHTRRTATATHAHTHANPPRPLEKLTTTMARRRLLLRLRRRRTRQRTSRCRESRTSRSSAPGSGSPPTKTPHLHRDWAGPCRICPTTGLSTSSGRYCTAQHWHAKQGGARFQPPILSLLQMLCPQRRFGRASPSPGADAARGEPESLRSCGGVSPFLEQLN